MNTTAKQASRCDVTQTGSGRAADHVKLIDEFIFDYPPKINFLKKTFKKTFLSQNFLGYKKI